MIILKTTFNNFSSVLNKIDWCFYFIDCELEIISEYFNEVISAFKKHSIDLWNTYKGKKKSYETASKAKEFYDIGESEWNLNQNQKYYFSKKSYLDKIKCNYQIFQDLIMHP